jgi:hypothetical protein
MCRAIPATLDYNGGVATDEDRILYSGGAQLDLSYTLGDSHILRGGLTYLHESVTADTTTTVFDVDGAGDATGGYFSIGQDNTRMRILAACICRMNGKSCRS